MKYTATITLHVQADSSADALWKTNRIVKRIEGERDEKGDFEPIDTSDLRTYPGNVIAVDVSYDPVKI